MGRRAKAELLALTLLVAGCECGPPPVVADATLDFGEIEVGATAKKRLVIANPSSRTLELQSLTTPLGAFSVAFVAVSVPAMGQASFEVTFKPTRGAAFVDELVLRSSGGMSRVTLRGVGKSQVVCQTFDDVDFGVVQVGVETIRALALPSPRLVGGQTGAFAVSSHLVRFTPPVAGSFTADVEVMENGCAPVRFALRGLGATKPLECVENPIEFGAVSPGATKRREVVVQNSGAADVTIALSVGAPFSVVSSLMVPARGSASVGVDFRPTALGTLEKRLLGGGLDCVLRGTGGGPDIEVTPVALAFGQIPFFATAPTPFFVERSFTIRNVGTTALTVSQVRLISDNGASSLSEIELSPLPATSIAAGGSSVMTVKVIPSSANKNLGWRLVVASDDLDEPETTVQVTAQSVDLPPCNYSVTPTALDFGRVAPPDRRDLKIAIRNLGMNMNEKCLLTSLELAPGSDPVFSLPTGPVFSKTLAPSEVLELVVRVAPTTATSTLVQAMGSVRFGISSPTAPQRLVPLTAQVGFGCIAVSPRELKFGSVKLGCNSETRNVTLYNTCAVPVTLQTVTLPTSELTSTVTPGMTVGTSPVTVPIVYAPSSVGPDSGSLVFRFVQNGQTVDEVVAFSGSGSSDGSNVDVFQVTANGKVDFLVVRDDSASMSNLDAHVRSGMDAFMQAVLASSTDFHLGVTYTELGNPLFGVLRGTPNVLTRATPNVAQAFSSRIATSLTGSNEALAGAAVAALKDSRNAGFLRSDARLSVIVISDHEESEVDHGADLAQLERAYGNYNVIAAGPMGCMVGQTYESSIAHALDGLSFDVCKPDWSPAVNAIVQRALDTGSSFTLAAEPEAGISVEVDGFIVLPQSGSQTVWSYDPSIRRLTFTANYRLTAPATVRVTYSTACH